MSIFRHALEGWRFSAHSHPGVTRTVLIPSDGDRMTLRLFNEMGTQTQSVILNSIGESRTFRSSVFDEMFPF